MTHLSQKYSFNVYKISTLKEMSVIIPPLQKYSCKHLRGVVDVYRDEADMISFCLLCRYYNQLVHICAVSLLFFIT